MRGRLARDGHRANRFLEEVIETERDEELRCGHCGNDEFFLEVLPLRPNPVLSGRIIYRCTRCGYWTDFIDGRHWHPPEGERDAET